MAKKKARHQKPSESRDKRKPSSVARKQSPTSRRPAHQLKKRVREPRSDDRVQPRAKKTPKGRQSKKVDASHVQRKKPRTQKQKDFLLRSLASKKGWMTRKYNQKVRAIEQGFIEREQEYKKALKKQRKELVGKEKVVVYMQKELRDKGREIHKKIEKAAEKARAEAEKEFNKNLAIMERLNKAQLEGNFDEVAYEIADEEGKNPQEIYTLWSYNGAID